ncbi:carbon-nitrogen hydrolase family protein [Solirubrobacter soli]|uniref:carbon-nitrogen hydrolase family protein n=1 Tax=Solirubrobacter soli TaxID=363832 RepID=UPI0004851215|nr:carbon-nitrogen hydrolase family protein [Solirubrobacter soli]
MREPLTVAVAQPAPTVEAHAAAIREAKARLVVFPELSVTGYELDADAPEDLSAIVDACAETGSIALVGAPVDGSIATVRVDEEGASVVYRKSFLGGDEATRFTPGPGATSIDVDGWRVGLGICKDTGVQQHIDDTAALKPDLYVAGLVHHDHELEEQERRAHRIATACDAYVAFASFAGPTGGGFTTTAAESAIYSADGRALARAGAQPGAFARFTLT